MSFEQELSTRLKPLKFLQAFHQSLLPALQSLLILFSNSRVFELTRRFREFLLLTCLVHQVSHLPFTSTFL